MQPLHISSRASSSTGAAAAAAAAGRADPPRHAVVMRRSRAARQALLACLVGWFAVAAASSGDESVLFRRCHSLCLRSGCAGAAAPAPGQLCSQVCPMSSSSNSGSSGSSSSFSSSQPEALLPLQLLRWDCASDCSYLCMWKLEGSRRAGARVQKYYGKWPFVRLLGMQEPASVLFSLLNLAAHAHCLLRLLALRRQACAQVHKQQQQENGGAASSDGGVLVKPAATAAAPTLDPGTAAAVAGYPYTWLWVGHMLLSINAWLWSAVFHSRDTRLTERLDYFSAAGLIFFNLFLSIVRTFHLRSPGAMLAVAAPLLAFLASHFRHMLYVLFDYGYHVKVCIAAGAAQSLLWVGWAVRTSPPGAHQLYTFVLLVNSCMLLEVLDFPPLLHTLDAHSLWHLATVPLVYLFYHFIATDLTTAPFAVPGAAGKKAQ